MSAFDRLCWFAERFPALLGPSLSQMLRQAHLFSFPHVSHDVLPKTFTDEELRFHRDYFVLPFRVVAVEDKTSVVLLWDADPDQVGLCRERFFIELASLSAMQAKTWRDADQEAQARAALPPELRNTFEHSCNFSFGMLKVADIEQHPREDGTLRSRYTMHGQLMSFHILDENGPRPEGIQALAQFPDDTAAMAVRNGMVAIEELMTFNRPDRFIVRETPAKIRDPNGPKVPRSHERPIYTLLHAQEARTKLGVPFPSEGTHSGSRFVGERRRHVRRYPDDPARWPKAHGKTVVIPATWVGPHEAQVGRRHYSIMLDL